MNTIRFKHANIICKIKTAILLLMLIAIAGCTNSSVTIINDRTYPLINKNIVIKNSLLKLEGTEFIKITSETGEAIPFQCDDLNNDGKWDEIALQLDLAAEEQFILKIEKVDSSEKPIFKKLTHARLGYSPERNDSFSAVERHTRPKNHKAQSTPYLYQFEGPGWENNNVGFRLYFDSRNGKDIFGKTTNELVIDKVGLEGNYHKLQAWGMDVLKVGSSLGAGSLAILKNDSLVRLSDTEEAIYELVTTGPVRSIIKLTYTGWHTGGQPQDIIETITIWANLNSYESNVSLIPHNTPDTLVTGIVDLKQAPKFSVEHETYQAIYTYGKQSENNDQLGMGIIIDQQNFLAFSEAKKDGEGITNTYTAYLKPYQHTYRYRFFAGWELQNKTFSDRQAFEDALKEEAISFTTPIQIKIDKL